MSDAIEQATDKQVALQPKMAMPPQFETMGEERLYRKRRLAAAFRLFGLYGYDEGPAGHITARDPEFPNRFWVNPFGMHFSCISVKDLLLVDHDGTVLEGTHPVNRAAFAIHSRLHAARPDVTAAAHSHSMYGKAFSSLGRLLKPITQDACAFYDDHVLFDDYTGVVLDLDEGDRIAAKLGNKKAAILQNHGFLTVGGSVDSAVYFFIAMERCAKAQLVAEACGKVIEIEDEVAALTYKQVGFDGAGWFSFQGLYDMIVRQQPDLLD